MEYGFNIRFTRPDENNEFEYEIGFNVRADNLAAGEARARLFNDHVTILSVKHYFTVNEDGDIVWTAEAEKEAL